MKNVEIRKNEKIIFNFSAPPPPTTETFYLISVYEIGFCSHMASSWKTRMGEMKNCLIPRESTSYIAIFKVFFTQKHIAGLLNVFQGEIVRSNNVR